MWLLTTDTVPSKHYKHKSACVQLGMAHSNDQRGLHYGGIYSATPSNIFFTGAYSLNKLSIFKDTGSSEQMTLAEIVFMLYIYIHDMLSLLYNLCIMNLCFYSSKHV